jgi:hypothetical protein
VKDICGKRFEQTWQGIAGATIPVAPRRQLMDHPGPVAEAVAGGEDPTATGREPEPPGDDQYPVAENEQT